MTLILKTLFFILLAGAMVGAAICENIYMLILFGFFSLFFLLALLAEAFLGGKRL